MNISCEIILNSKNKKLILEFFNFVLLLINYVGNVYEKHKLKIKKTKRITLLKSPHVHKSAQENYEIKNYYYKIQIKSTQFFKIIYIFKKINYNGLADLNMHIKLFFDNNNFYFKKLLDPKNCKILMIYSKKKKAANKIINLLRIYNMYGKMLIKS